METNRSILIIENQHFHFKRIVENFNRDTYESTDSYTIYPLNNDFILFIDHVRVWINEQYTSDYRNRAWEYIENYFSDKEIELIVMDHILGGAHHCLTGIDLATELNKNRREKSEEALPVFFLSKTEHTEESRFKKYQIYDQAFPNTSTWVHKGFFGDEILNPDYFKDHVIPEIEILLGLSNEQKFWKKLEVLISDPEWHKHYIFIKEYLITLQDKSFENIPDQLINDIISANSFIDLDTKLYKK